MIFAAAFDRILPGWAARAGGSFDAPTGLRVIGHVYASQAGDYYDLRADDVPSIRA